MKGKFTLPLALWVATAVSPPTMSAAEPLPYYNPCEDLSTITVVNAGTGNKAWAVYGTKNQFFRHAPNGTSTSTVSTATLWTKELDIQAGKTYKIKVGVGVWKTNNATKAIVSLYKTPESDAEKTDLATLSPVPAKLSNPDRPRVGTYYVRADASTGRYLGIANRGGGNYNWFMVDDISVEESDPTVPSTVTDLSATAEGKSVTVSFTAPTKSVVNETLTTIAKVKLMRDGKTIKEWTDVNPGTPLSLTDNVSHLGELTYSVVCINNNIEGEATATTVTVGGSNLSSMAPTVNNNYQYYFPGTETKYGRSPMAYATYDAAKGCRITWQPFNAGDGIDVAYTVRRLSDSKIIAEKTSALEAYDADALSTSPGIYTYTITAYYTAADAQTETERQLYTSTTLSTHISLPYTLPLTQEAGYEYTFIDNNGDMSAWGFKKNSYNTPNVTNHFYARVGDEHMISPGIDLKGGKTYRIDITAFCDSYIPKVVGLEVLSGTSNNISSMTETVRPETVLLHNDTRHYSAYINPETDGQKFFDLHATNPTDREEFNGIGIAGFEIYEVSGETPEAIAEIKVEYGVPGKATLVFDSPSKDVRGNDLTSLTRIEVLLNGTVIRTIDNPAAGAENRIDITVAPGKNDVYTVIPYVGDNAGLETTASVMILEAPYENHFDSDDYMTGFSVIDVNNTGYTWGYQLQSARSYPSSEFGHDSYLITPPIQLEGGKFYKIGFLTWLGDIVSESTNEIELLLGTAPEVSALTTTVIEPYTVLSSNKDKAYVREWFTVPETGQYYLAWHSKSPAGSAIQLFIDDIAISDAIPSTYPNAVTGFEVTPDPTGELKADISFKLPETDLAGVAMAGNIYKYEILRDGTLLKGEFSKAPGTEISYEDTEITTGVHLYTVVCYGAYGKPSRDVSTAEFIGINKPTHVRYVEAAENPDKYGEVTIKWGAPTTDIDGFNLNTTEITYTVGRVITDLLTGELTQDVFATGITETEYTHTLFEGSDHQEFCRFFVRPATSAGEGGPNMVSNYLAVGQPYSLPLTESFSNYMPQLTCVTQRTGDGSPAQWGFNKQNPVTGIEAVDNDNGLAIMEAMFRDGGNRILFGRVTLTGEHPSMSFYVYNTRTTERPDQNLLSVELREGDSEPFAIATKTIDEWTDNTPGWQKATVDLSEYAGKTVYFAFNGTIKSSIYIHLDKITISEAPAVDLAIPSASLEPVHIGIDHKITARVLNNGIGEAAGATLNLSLDGEKIKSIELEPLAAGASTDIEITSVLGRDKLGHHVYTVSVEHADDADLIDNTTTTEPFDLVDNTYPEVENLAGIQSENSVKLTWDEPTLPTEPETVTDGAEDIEAWSTIRSGLGIWTTYDLDNAPIGGFQQFDLPNASLGTTQGFFIFDASTIEQLKDQEWYQARSGSKCFASSYTIADGSAPQDLLVSPLLPGNAQTISFYARATNDGYPESFKVFYSTEGNTPDELHQNCLASETQLKGSWKEFSYDLPEGTRYFAIEHLNSYNTGIFFFVDDITFQPAGDESLRLDGFRIYNNDGLQIASTTERSFTDSTPAEGKNRYSVTAVYDLGESPAEEVSVDFSGIGTLAAESVRVSAGEGEIIVEKASGLTIKVYTPDGLFVTDRIGGDITRIAVAQGIYIVTVGNKSYKVIAG